MAGTFLIWSPVTLWAPTEHAKRRLKVTERLVMAPDPEQLFFVTEEPCDLSHQRFKFKCLICFLTLSLRPHLMMHPHLSTTWPPLPAHTQTHPVPAGFEAETTAVFACDVLIEQPHPVETVRQKIFHQSDRKHKHLHKVTLFRNIEHFTVYLYAANMNVFIYINQL